MIVRIATEGQYELAENDAETLDQLDHQAVAACQGGDEAQFNRAFMELITFVRTNGQSVSHDQLVGSDLILPPPDSTLGEAKAELTGDGWIPD